MSIKQKSFLSLIVVFLSMIILVGVVKYSNYKINQINDKADEIDNKIVQVEKIKSNYYKFLSIFEKSILQNKKTNLNIVAKNCDVGKFLDNYEKDLDKNNEIQKLKFIHDNLHKMVEIFDDKFVKSGIKATDRLSNLDENDKKLYHKIVYQTIEDVNEMENFLDRYIGMLKKEKQPILQEINTIETDMFYLEVVIILLAIVGFIFLVMTILSTLTQILGLKKI